MTELAQAVNGVLADGRVIHYYGTAPDDDQLVDSRAMPTLEVATSCATTRCTTSGSRSPRTGRSGPTCLKRVNAHLCPSTAERQTEIPATDYEVVVFDNRFPSFGGSSGGACEVVCFTPDHARRFADLTPDRARLVIDAWADRTRRLSERRDVEQVFIFENRGEEIGVTLHHPHGQIYALPFVAPRTRRMLDVLEQHPERVSLLVDKESTGPRVVVDAEHWVAFVPDSARWPLELHVYPRRQVPDLAGLDASQLADVYLRCLGALDRLYDAPLPYISA